MCTALKQQITKFQQKNMNYIPKVFSPRVNLTRIDDKDITDTIPPINFTNLNMDHGKHNQVLTK